MNTYTVMVSVNIEAQSLEDAEDKVGGMIKYLPKQYGHPYEAQVLTDCETDNYNQRVFYSHPADTHAEYDVEEYNRLLDEELDEELRKCEE